MLPTRIAVATRCFNLPLKQALRAAADAGAQGVQFDSREELAPGSLGDTGRRQFLHELDERGLRVASLVFPTRHAFYEEDRLDARVIAVKTAMEFAWQLKSSVLTARIGKIPADANSKEHILLREVLSDLARHGNHVGVTFAITPTHDSPDALGALLGSIKTGPLGLDFDPASFAMAGHSPEQAFRTLHASVIHFQARDGLRDIDGSGLEVPLGRGEVDWVELLPLLTEISYRGWITVNRTQGDDRAGDVARGVQFLKNVLP